MKPLLIWNVSRRIDEAGDVVFLATMEQTLIGSELDCLMSFSIPT